MSMRSHICFHLLFLVGISSLTSVSWAKPNASEIIRKMEAKLRGDSSYIKAKIVIEKTRVTRTVEFESWESKKLNCSFIRILKPKKDRRITFLKIKQNLWQYIPKIGKEIKIEASLMNDSWMGSDFTNDDLVRETSLTDDYNHSFAKSDDTKLYKIILTAKPNKPAVWDKMILHVRKRDLLPQSQEFFDHKDRLKRKMEFGNYRIMGKRLIPARFRMMSLSKKRTISTTTMFYLRAAFDLAIPKHIFSKANLRK